MKKRTRPIRMNVYFTKEELDSLQNKADQVRLSKGEYIRRTIAEKEIRAAPTEDIHKLVWAMYAMAGQARRLVELAEETRVADASDMRKLLDRMYRGIELAVNCVARD